MPVRGRKLVARITNLRGLRNGTAYIPADAEPISPGWMKAHGWLAPGSRDRHAYWPYRCTEHAKFLGYVRSDNAMRGTFSCPKCNAGTPEEIAAVVRVRRALAKKEKAEKNALVFY
jgi:hypothetical protein